MEYFLIKILIPSNNKSDPCAYGIGNPKCSCLRKSICTVKYCQLIKTVIKSIKRGLLSSNECYVTHTPVKTYTPTKHYTYTLIMIPVINAIEEEKIMAVLSTLTLKFPRAKAELRKIQVDKKPHDPFGNWNCNYFILKIPDFNKRTNQEVLFKIKYYPYYRSRFKILNFGTP